MLLDSMAKCCTEVVLGEELLWRLCVSSSIPRFRLFQNLLVGMRYVFMTVVL
jgi:hypothetical protein